MTPGETLQITVDAQGGDGTGPTTQSAEPDGPGTSVRFGNGGSAGAGGFNGGGEGGIGTDPEDNRNGGGGGGGGDFDVEVGAVGGLGRSVGSQNAIVTSSEAAVEDGGSGFGPAGVVFETGVREGDGVVTITYDPDAGGCPQPAPPAAVTTVVAQPRFTG